MNLRYRSKIWNPTRITNRFYSGPGAAVVGSVVTLVGVDTVVFRYAGRRSPGTRTGGAVCRDGDLSFDSTRSVNSWRRTFAPSRGSASTDMILWII